MLRLLFLQLCKLLLLYLLLPVAHWGRRRPERMVTRRSQFVSSADFLAPCHAFAPGTFACDCQAMSHEGSSSPSRSLTSAREYGSTPRGRRNGPASVDCSPMRAACFPATPEGQEDFQPPDTEDALLEGAAALDGYEGSSPQGEGREVWPSPCRGQAGSSPHWDRREVGLSTRHGQEGSSPDRDNNRGSPRSRRPRSQPHRPTPLGCPYRRLLRWPSMQTRPLSRAAPP